MPEAIADLVFKRAPAVTRVGMQTGPSGAGHGGSPEGQDDRDRGDDPQTNAALRIIVRRDSGETYQEFLTRLAQASGIETRRDVFQPGARLF